MKKQKIEFPHFIASTTFNKKGTQTIIAHLIFPRAVFKVFPKLIDPSRIPLKEQYIFIVFGNHFNTVLLDCEDCSDAEKQALLETAHAWYANQPT